VDPVQLQEQVEHHVLFVLDLREMERATTLRKKSAHRNFIGADEAFAGWP
jgi:hypothetical protein